MNDLKQQLKQVGMMHHAQQIMLRVIKAGLYGHEVAGDVERSKNYLEELNKLTENQMKILKEALKAQPSTKDMPVPADAEPVEPVTPTASAVEAPKVD